MQSPVVHLLHDAKQRVRSFLEELERLSELEFPYPDAKNALLRLQSRYLRTLDELEEIDAGHDDDVVVTRCRTSVVEIYEHLRYLGFILGSTDVRNAFEAFGPLKRLAQSVLEPEKRPEDRKIQLVMSSEWQYSPFVFHSPRGLSDFVLIGLPAQESTNPLLLPLTGHELGHSYWIRNGLDMKYGKLLLDATLDALPSRWTELQVAFPAYTDKKPSAETYSLFAQHTWGRAVEMSRQQAKETFCDFFGLRLFGASYLRAFTYFLSPGFGRRLSTYPDTATRVDNMVTAAKLFEVTLSADAIGRFEPDRSATDSETELFLRSLADDMQVQFVETLAAEVADALQEPAVALPRDNEANKIVARFRHMVPAEGARCMADILNAAWLASDDNTFWQDPGLVGSTRKTEVLRELCLKNLEVFEIGQRLGETWRVQG